MLRVILINLWNSAYFCCWHFDTTKKLKWILCGIKMCKFGEQVSIIIYHKWTNQQTNKNVWFLNFTVLQNCNWNRGSITWPPCSWNKHRIEPDKTKSPSEVENWVNQGDCLQVLSNFNSVWFNTVKPQYISQTWLNLKKIPHNFKIILKFEMYTGILRVQNIKETSGWDLIKRAA